MQLPARLSAGSISASELPPDGRVRERWSPGTCVTVEFRGHRAPPMADDRVALVALLQKSRDGDFLRAEAEAVLHLMEADVEA